MPIIGFAFNKINVERTGNLTKTDKIQNNVKVTSIKESKMRMGQEEKESVNVSFEFTVDYSKAGKLELLGTIVYFESPDKVKVILQEWSKEEKMPQEFGVLMYNYIIKKCVVKSLALEEDMGLPLHIVLPKVQVKKK